MSSIENHTVLKRTIKEGIEDGMSYTENAEGGEEKTDWNNLFLKRVPAACH